MSRQLGAVQDLEDLAEEAAFALEELEEAAGRLSRVRGRLETLVGELDPEGIATSIPGIGLASAGACLAALGSHDFRSVKACRAYTGLVPRVAASGQTLRRGLPLTKAGPTWLRTALYLAAESARRWDPELAKVYHRAMVTKGHPHRKAVSCLSRSRSR